MGRPESRARARAPRCRVARLLAVDEAGGTVLTPTGPVRGTWGGPMLVARAAGMRRPRSGDAVLLVRWPDGRLTLDPFTREPLAAPDAPPAPPGRRSPVVGASGGDGPGVHPVDHR